MARTTLTVSIVSGASADALSACLRSLAAAGGAVEMAVRVVDNCAPFEVAGAIPAVLRSRTTILRNPERRGFGANHNKVLRGLDTAFALVLNDDVELAGGALDEMLRVALAHPKAGMVGATLYACDWAGPPIRGGGLPDAVAPPPVKVCLYHLMRLACPCWTENTHRIDTSPPGAETRELSYVSGACALLRREMLRDVGLYDEGFRMYFEDIDLGRRARDKGWRCLQAKAARVKHLEGSSFSAATWPWLLAGARRYAHKHHGPATRLATDALAAALGAVVRAKRGGAAC